MHEPAPFRCASAPASRRDHFRSHAPYGQRTVRYRLPVLAVKRARPACGVWFLDQRLSSLPLALILQRPSEPFGSVVVPEIFKPVWSQLAVAHRMLDILVAEIGLQAA